jgi:hypothetical protein
MVNVDTVEWLRAYTAALDDMRQFDDSPDEHVNEVINHLTRAADELAHLRAELAELKEWRRFAVQRITGI